ncbi:MAG: hypothetical protein COB26_07345 [Piscirickettsiaceae bacterium]|nr:MAG: hypothetical protein COB26_07345 [Piscirickettsiaceae bacterium]
MLIKQFERKTVFLTASSLLLILVTSQLMAQPKAQEWTLEASVQQAIIVSPELKSAIAEIGVRQADIELSSLWADPEIEFRVDNKMGQDDRAGGYDLSEITISQPIPISRIKYQEEAASASMQAARFSLQYQSLKLEHRVSKVFHRLQFESAKLSLAEQQLKLANNLSGRNNSNSNIVRYLTPLEEMRLSIIREEASQAAGSAEGHYSEAFSYFVQFLGIENNVDINVSKLLPVTKIPTLSKLSNLQNKHVQLSSQHHAVLAANHQINVARSSQMVDPSISFSWQKDTLSTGREDVYAVMFNIQIPFSDRENIAANKATHRASQQKIELNLLKRELRLNLDRSHAHLKHIVEQSIHYKNKVLKPAAKMLQLTKNGFSSGELNVLSLVDANNTYFDARLIYLELLYQARVELAEVRLFAGQVITDTQYNPTFSNNLRYEINTHQVGE